jgi:predicted RND superfamily exporter protein
LFNRFGLLADWIVDHRWVTFIAIVAFTVVMAIGHVDPYLLLPDPGADVAQQPVAGEAESSDSEDAPPQNPPPNVKPVRVARGDVIVVARSDDFFKPDGADAIRAAVEALESLPYVESLLWMDRAPMLNIFGLPEPILPKRNASPARFEAAKKRALEHPLVGGQLLSPDGNTVLLLLQIDFLFVTSDADIMEGLRDTASAAAAKFPGAEIDFQITGNVPIGISSAESNRANEIKYQVIGYSMALIIAFILFRGLSSVLIVAMAPAFGVFWTLGMLHYLGYDDNPFNSVIVPVLLCMVGFTDGVHMMVQIRRHRAAGQSPADAARMAIREVGLACWLTSLTTAIGFGSLVMARHEVVREFGYCCVIGVLLTFVSVVTIIPLACASPLGRRVHSGYGRNLVDHNLQRIVSVIDFVLQRSGQVSAIAIAVTAVLAILTLQLRPDERLTGSLSAGTEPAAALAHIDQAFGGMETANVDVHWERSVKSDAGEIATVVQEVDRLLQAEPLIGHPLSIVSLIHALPGEGDPSTRMSLLELLPPPLKRAYYTPEHRRAQVSFRLQDLGIARYGPVFERLEQGLESIQREHPDFTVTLSGGAVRRWQNLYKIVVDLARSLGTASLIIFGVLTLVYRSLRLGMISVIPNVFPLAVTGFVLWLAGQSIELVSVCAFTVCLGIAVDDTIHFLTRYQEESASVADRKLAIRNAFVGVGTALVMTTVVLVIGFSTALLSDARDHRIFAMMGILTIGSALFADLVFLPALLLRYAPSNLRRGKGVRYQ